MSTVMTTVEKWQDEFFDMVDRVEEPVVRFTGEMTESVVDYVPSRPDWSFFDRVPTISEVVENQLKFTTRFVDDQVAFVRKMMKAMQPAVAKMDGKAEHKTVRAPKKATPKATPKTA